MLLAKISDITITMLIIVVPMAARLIFVRNKIWKENVFKLILLILANSDNYSEGISELKCGSEFVT